MRTMRLVASVVGALALTSCGSDGNDVIEFDGQCDGSYEVLPPELGDPPFRTRVVIDAFCELGSLGDFQVQTFQFVDDNDDGTADLTASTIYTDAFGNELFSDFAGTSTETGTGVTFGGTETYEGGIGDYGAATGSADISGITNLADQTISYIVQGELAPN
jgi:hypothetical protein